MLPSCRGPPIVGAVVTPHPAFTWGQLYGVSRGQADWCVEGVQVNAADLCKQPGEPGQEEGVGKRASAQGMNKELDQTGPLSRSGM